MDLHHLAPFVAAWSGFLASQIGAAVAIVLGLWCAKRQPSRRFDFAASARRIRNRPIPPRGEA